MNGKALEQRLTFPLLAGLCLLFTAVLIGIAAYGRTAEPAIFATLPGFIGLFLLVSGRQHFYAEITDTGLSFDQGDFVVAFNDIDHLWTKDTRINGPVYVFHQNGMFKIPVLSAVANSEVYAYLRDAIPQTVPPPNSRVSNYFQTQSQLFGPDKAWAYVQRPRFTSGEPVGLRIFGWATIVAAIVWLFGGIAVNAPWLFCCAIAMLVLGPVMISNAAAEPNSALAKHYDSCLVIGPAGIALTQGDLIGELRWPEVHGAKFLPSSQNRRRRIRLQVEGAHVEVLDLYNGPLDEIFARIDRYWRAG